MKTCTCCGIEKPISEYNKHPNMADGHIGKCRDCRNKHAKQYRLDNREKINAYQRQYRKTERGKELRAISDKKYQKAFPEKINAKQVIYTGIQRGKIKRLPCEVCGSSVDVHAHHSDYTKPRQIVWLCRQHHMEEHKPPTERDT